MRLFGSEPVDFEAQIAEINASAERRRAILTQLDPWEEEAEFIKRFRAKIEELKRRHRNRTA